jgi:hypothetical protein
VLEELKNNTQKPQEILLFKEKMIGLLLMFLDNQKANQQDKITILELL